jgi:hypothetical protein
VLVPQEPPETTGGAASWAGAGAVSCVGADSGAPADSSAGGEGEVGSGVGVGSCEGADPADPSGVDCGDCSGGWTGCVEPEDAPVLGVRDPVPLERDVPGALSVLPGKALAATS